MNDPIFFPVLEEESSSPSEASNREQRERGGRVEGDGAHQRSQKPSRKTDRRARQKGKDFKNALKICCHIRFMHAFSASHGVSKNECVNTT